MKQNRRVFLTLVFLIGFAVFSFFYLDKGIGWFFYHNAPEDSILYELAEVWTSLGDSLYVILFFLFLILFYKNKKQKIYDISVMILSSVIISGIIVNILKFLIGRSRPSSFFYQNIYEFNFINSDFLYAFTSMPSGHSATAMAMFGLLSLVFPKYKKLFLIIGVSVCFSRVVLWWHFVSDIIIGGLIGYMVSYIIFRSKKYEKISTKL